MIEWGLISDMTIDQLLKRLMESKGNCRREPSPNVSTECRVDGQVQTKSLLTLELLKRIFLLVWRDAPGC